MEHQMTLHEWAMGPQLQKKIREILKLNYSRSELEPPSEAGMPCLSFFLFFCTFLYLSISIFLLLSPFPPLAISLAIYIFLAISIFHTISIFSISLSFS